MNKHLSQAAQLLQEYRFLEAAALCKKALRKPLDFVQAKRMLALCYYNQGVADCSWGNRLQDGERHFRLALEYEPKHADALNNLGALLLTQNRLEEALGCYEKLVALQPQRLTARRDLITTYQRLERLDAAQAQLEALDALLPDDGSAQLREALLLHSVMPDADYAVRVRAHMAERLEAFLAAGKPIADPAWLGATAFYLPYHGVGNKALHQRIAAAHLQASPSLAWQAPWLATWAGVAGRRIRIGLASGNFFDHSIGHTSLGLLEKLDKTRFEVMLIRLGVAPPDAMAQALDANAERVVTVANNDLQAAREQIAALQLDILFWQDIGMEPLSYLLAFARLAPVQLTSFGHPDTTGIPNMDYFLSSDYYETSASPEQYSERLWCLRGLGTLAYYHRPQPPAGPTTRTAFGLAAQAHIYLCPQTLFKIHPQMDAIFLEILQRDPLAEIVLIGASDNPMQLLLQARLARCSPVLTQRVRFLPRMAHADYLRLMQCADVILDTVHFNGQNTSLEAFALGCPIVTWPGSLQRARHTAGMYQAMGFMQLVAHSQAEYVGKAVRLACDSAFAQAARAEIAVRCAVLFANEDFIHQCAAAFEEMLAYAPKVGLGSDV